MSNPPDDYVDPSTITAPSPEQSSAGLASLIATANGVPRSQPSALRALKPTDIIPSSPDDIKNEYSQWLVSNPKGDPVSLGHFAQGMDQREGSQRRQNFYDMTDAYGTDSLNTVPAFQSPAQRAIGGVSDEIDSDVGTNSSIGQSTGAVTGIAGDSGDALASMLGIKGTKFGDLARSVGSSLPRAALMAETGGLSLMAGDVGAQTYGKTGNLAAAGLAAGTSAIPVLGAEAGSSIGESLVAKSLLRNAEPNISSLVTGIAPKIGAATGALVGGIGGQEVARQVQTGGSIPNVNDIAADVFGGASMAIPESYNTLVGTRGAINTQATADLVSWTEGKASDVLASRGVTPDTTRSPVTQLINDAVSPSETDTDPDWRKNAIVTKMNDLSKETDPQMWASRVSELTNMVVDSKNMDAISDSAERDAKMAYVMPPSNITELTDLARRINTLKQDALAKLDEMNTQGVEGATSSAAYNQLEAQGYLNEPIDMEWMKTHFGDNVERSLTNSNSTAYSIMTQQMANRLLILAQVARDARAQDISQSSAQMPDQSKGVIQDRVNTANFFDAMGKIPDQDTTNMALVNGLTSRFLYHEAMDNKGDFGTTPKFMQTVTDIINQHTAGKSSDQLGQIDWTGAKAQLEQTMRQPSDDGLGQQNVTVARPTSLGDLTAKDFNGDYVNKIYGRPNRSQKEILASDLPTSPTGRTVLDSKSTAEGLNQPGSDDWNAMSDQVKQTIATMPDKELWNTIAPEFKNTRGLVHPSVQSRLEPIVKDLVQAVFELGPKGENSAMGPLGDAGQRVLAKLGGQQEGQRTPASQLAVRLNSIFAGPGRDPNVVRQGIVKRVAEKAGLQVPQGAAVFNPWGATSRSNGGEVLGTVENGNLVRGPVQVYRIFREGLMRQGYEPEMVDRATRTVLRVAQISQNPDLAYNLLSKESAYPGNPTNPLLTDTRVLGLYTPTKSLISLAFDHQVGNAPKALNAWLMMATHLHEILHDTQDLANGHQGVIPATAYIQENVGAWNALSRAADFYTTAEKFQFLRIAAEAVVPKEVLYSGGINSRGNTNMHPTIQGLLTYGSSTPNAKGVAAPNYEFVNVFSQILGLGMLTGENHPISPENVFMQMPEEQALFAKGFYRNYHDQLSALQDAMIDPQFREDAGLPALKGDLGYLTHQMTWLVNQTNRLLRSAEPAKSMAQANALAQALKGKSWTGPITTTEYKAQYSSMTPQEAIAAKSAMVQTQGWLFGGPAPSVTTALSTTTGKPPVTPTGTQLTFPFPAQGRGQPPANVNMGAFWKYIALFQQGMDHMQKRGVPLASDVAVAVRDYIPAQNRIMANILGAFTRSNGKFDMTNPLIQLATNSDSIQGRRDRDLLNKIGNWQQRNDSQEALEQDPQGNWGLTAKAQKDLGLVSSSTNPSPVPQIVVAGVHALQQVGQVMGQQLLGSRISSAANRTAQLILAIYPHGQLKPIGYEQAQKDSIDIVNGLVHGGSLTAAAGTALGNYPVPIRTTIEGFLNSGMVDSLKNLANLVNTRPGWMNEQRPGAYLVTSEKNGVAQSDGAESASQARKMQLEMSRQGFTNIKIVNKAERAKLADYDSPEGILQNFIQKENEHLQQYLTTNPQGLSQQQLDTIRTYAPSPGEASQQMIQTKGTNKFLIKRQGTPAALGLDYIDNMRDYVGRLAGTIARGATQQQVQLIFADPRMADQPSFATYVNDNLSQMMTPASDMERSMKAFSSAYFIAGHIGSVMTIGTHAINTLPETLLDKGGQGYSTAKAAQHVGAGFNDWVQLSSQNSQAYIQKTARTAALKIGTGQPVSPDELKAWSYQRAVENHILDGGVLDSTFDDNDQKALMARAFESGNPIPKGPGAIASSALYRVAKGGMLLPRMASSFNNGWAFMAGINLAIHQGLPADKAYQFADNIRTLALFAGGKSNLPGYMGVIGPKVVPIARTMHTLQQFGFGVVGRYMEHMSDAIRTDPNIAPGQRAQALKAFGSLTMTQLAMGGLMALPGVAALMTLAYKYFNVQPEAGVRQGIAHLAGADKDNSGFRGILTEIAMNGIPNQVLGVNIGPRLGVQDFMGTSAYDGFNLSDLAGPTGSVVTNMVTGVGQIAQGNIQRGVTTLLPNAFKKAVDLGMNKMNYGDYAQRSPITGQKLYDPTIAEVLEQATGLTPTRISQRQNAQRLITQSNRAYEQQQSAELDHVAGSLLQGNRQPAQTYQQEQLQSNPALMRNPTKPLQSVATRASQLSQPPDALGSAPVGNASSALGIANSFPPQTTQSQSELDKMRQELQLQGMLGAVPHPEQLKHQMSRAGMMDMWMQKGLTRAQAERMCQMLGL